jgi:hypothetical protein
VPGQTLDVPLVLNAGENVSIVTSGLDTGTRSSFCSIPTAFPSLAAMMPGSTLPRLIGLLLHAAPADESFFEGVITGTLRVSRE